MIGQFPPDLYDFLPLPPPKLPVPRFVAHKLGWNPSRNRYWPEKLDPSRWRALISMKGYWAARRAASVCPEGDWARLERAATSLYDTSLITMGIE